MLTLKDSHLKCFFKPTMAILLFTNLLHSYDQSIVNDLKLKLKNQNHNLPMRLSDSIVLQSVVFEENNVIKSTYVLNETEGVNYMYMLQHKEDIYDSHEQILSICKSSNWINIFKRNGITLKIEYMFDTGYRIADIIINEEKCSELEDKEMKVGAN